MPLGGLVPLVNMMLGEIIFGGVGSGLYGFILFAIIASLPLMAVVYFFIRRFVTRPLVRHRRGPDDALEQRQFGARCVDDAILPVKFIASHRRDDHQHWQSNDQPEVRQHPTEDCN